MNAQVLKEITPLTENDCFTVFTRHKEGFDFPLHYHEEFELNLIINAGGAKRIVGDNVETIDELELVLVGSGLVHAWFTHECNTKKIHEITIQWHSDLLDEKLLKRNQLTLVKAMFENAAKGISFEKETIKKLLPKLINFDKLQGFDAYVELLQILGELAASKKMKTLSSSSFIPSKKFNHQSRRLEKAFEYMSRNYDRKVTLTEVAKQASMTKESFSRFIRKRTTQTFVDTMNEIRLGHASYMLINNTHSICEISFQCGFNNTSHFNKIFKNKKGTTPKEFRANFTGKRTFV